MSQSEPLKDYWSDLFKQAIDVLAKRNYDLEGFSKSKSENGLTGLLQAELIAQSPSLHFYTEVSQKLFLSKADTRDSAMKTKGEDLSDESRVKGAFDLVCLESESLLWDKPKIYAEFKFLYTTDINDSSQSSSKKSDGEFINDKDLFLILKDKYRLQKIKTMYPETTCIQGFYICQNQNHYYLDKIKRDKRSNYCKHGEHGLCHTCSEKRYEDFKDFYADSKRLSRAIEQIKINKSGIRNENLKGPETEMNGERGKKFLSNKLRLDKELQILGNLDLADGIGDWEEFKLVDNSSTNNSFWLKLAMVEIGGKFGNEKL